MKEKLKILISIFENAQKYKIMMLIAHCVPEFCAYVDACLEVAGGYCEELEFCFFLQWLREILERTLNRVRKKLKNGRKLDKKMLTSINLLECSTTFKLYAAATQYLQEYDIACNGFHFHRSRQSAGANYVSSDDEQQLGSTFRSYCW